MPTKNSRLVTTLILTAFTMAAASCGEDASNLPEKVDKLRAIGVSTNPVVIAAPSAGTSGSVELTAYAALPKGGTVAASSFLDSASSFSTPVNVALQPETALTQNLAALDVYSIRGTITIDPLTAVQQATLAATGKLLLRYGIRLESGDESEDIVGNVLVYAQGSPETAYQPISVAVSQPVANGTVGSGPDQDLSGTITKPQDERVKVSWFVSTGKVTNRRARETKWEPGDSGAQTVIMTARGLKSGSFAMQAVDVTVE